jgi:hypothetical protein
MKLGSGYVMDIRSLTAWNTLALNSGLNLSLELKVEHESAEFQRRWGPGATSLKGVNKGIV